MALSFKPNIYELSRKKRFQPKRLKTSENVPRFSMLLYILTIRTWSKKAVFETSENVRTCNWNVPGTETFWAFWVGPSWYKFGVSAAGMFTWIPVPTLPLSTGIEACLIKSDFDNEPKFGVICQINDNSLLLFVKYFLSLTPEETKMYSYNLPGKSL